MEYIVYRIIVRACVCVHETLNTQKQLEMIQKYEPNIII